MKSHLFSLRAAYRFLAALAAVAMLSAVSASAQSTNWLSGANLFGNATYGTLADNDVLDNASLMITNGGNLTANQFNVGPTNRSTLILTNGGLLTVQQLLATNVACTTLTNSIFNFNGGTLTTSNNNGLASSILVASNATWTVNGNWTMNGGTNVIMSVATNYVITATTTNPQATANIYVGNVANNLTMAVNSNAVLWLPVPAGVGSNAMSLVVGNGNATNNVLMVNGGTLIATNNKSLGNQGTINVGYSSGSVSNQIIITNGGQIFSYGAGGGNLGIVYVGGINGSYNSLVVAGTNGAGRKSLWNVGIDRMYIGIGNTALSNNSVMVGSGGVSTNANFIT